MDNGRLIINNKQLVLVIKLSGGLSGKITAACFLRIKINNEKITVNYKYKIGISIVHYLLVIKNYPLKSMFSFSFLPGHHNIPVKQIKAAFVFANHF